MSNESTEYFSILTSKRPYESTEAIRIRLSQAKLINKDFYQLFKDVSDLKKNYVNQLSKIIAKNDNLEKVLSSQMISNGVLTPEEMEQFNFNSLGDLQPVWTALMDEFKRELRLSKDMQASVDARVIKHLKDSIENNSNWEETKRIHSHLTQVAASIEQSNGDNGRLTQAQSEWETGSPQLVELFETLDKRRLQAIKDSLLTYQTSYSDYLTQATSQSERSMQKILEFEPTNEIHRFVTDANNYNFQLVNTSNSTTQKQLQNDIPQNEEVKHNKEKRKSTFGNIGQRFTSSSSTILHHDLMNDEFSNSTNNVSLKNKKSSNTLRSKVGSIFGLKNRKSSHFGKHNSPVPETPALPTQQQQQKQQATNKPVAVSPDRPRSDFRQRGSQNSYSRPRKESTVSEVSNQTSEAAQINSNRYNNNNNNNVNEYVPANNNSAPISVAQAPLQPVQKSRQYSSNAEQKPLPAEPQFQVQGQYINNDSMVTNEASRPIHIQAPVLPPSRKQTISRDNDVFNDNQNTITTIPEQPVTQTNQPAQRTMSMLPTQITGELKELNPQSTGTSNVIRGQSLFQHDPTDTSISFGLNASVAEVLNATFKEGIIQQSQLIGEIALNYIPNTVMNTPLPIGINLKISNSSKFDSIILNQAFVEQVENEVFKLNPQFIDSRILGAIKYSIKEPLAPVVIQPAWKFEENQASVVLTVKMASFLPERIQQIVLNDVSVFVPIDGANATSALSKPQGSFSKEKRRITWRFKEPLVLTRNGEGKRLIARFITDRMAKESEKGISIKFAIRKQQDVDASDISLVSGLSLTAQEFDENDPFGGEWNPVHSSTTLSAGNYSGLS
ncbi:similar to Saccharomyces cerevisiae YCR030C SYP1 Protein of unknown function that is involved in endocytic site formation [Maudiozyma barnettii]|uniref:MHD domain-containing protein n=1 Tax=Maudiozyma barnettii TaxID=61262 RepID=A0A8H2VFK7_9SACH|nr:Syp1p [Kazachstania barnettii]CAB4254704.1 similar to Saccharomyces cerevisiae YCR030C SYP1 Protein of unknown function that is involved in endocytic site formation [Kazachstania barnettii]CAD1782746.1 similar to Saccharomyces cerevisiae YCR030C SYP1 Protein of unknown function that is involved in endocytic site formation [Kazachstania barnettii]